MWMVLERMRRRVSDLLMPNKEGEQKQNINKSNMCVKVGKWGLLSVRSSSTTKIIFKLQIAMQRSNIQMLRTRNLNLGAGPSSMKPQFRHYYSINTLLSTNLNTKSAKNLQQTRMLKEVTNIIHKFNSYYANIYHFNEHNWNEVPSSPLKLKQVKQSVFSILNSDCKQYQYVQIPLHNSAILWPFWIDSLFAAYNTNACV